MPRLGIRARFAVPALAAGALLAPSAGAVAATSGSLTQLSDPFGCHAASPPRGSPCSAAQGLSSASDIAVSPDGKSVYFASFVHDAIAAFARDPATGRLTQLTGPAACIVQKDGDPDCTQGKALNSPSAVATSADGKSVYVASFFSDAVAVFSRDTSGDALTQLTGANGCIRHMGGGCRSAKAMRRPVDLAVSPDGKHVYVVSQGLDGSDSGLSILRRKTTSGGPSPAKQSVTTPAPKGSLTFVGCKARFKPGSDCDTANGMARPVAVAVSPDGKNVYVASFNSDAVAVFSREASTGKLTQLAGSEGCVSDDTGNGPAAKGCKTGTALDGPHDVAVSPEGETVYVGSGEQGGAMAIFARDPGTGALGQVGCVNDAGAQGCASAIAFAPSALAVSPDGSGAYVASQLVGPGVQGSLGVFSRGLPGGLLTQLPGAEGCLTGAASIVGCAVPHDMLGAGAVAVAPDGRNVYVGTSNGKLVSFARTLGPTCVGKHYDNTAGSGAAAQLQCTEPANLPLTYSVVTAPAHGGLGPIDQASGNVLYSPEPNYIGPDSFTYRASNGTVDSPAATITINNHP